MLTRIFALKRGEVQVERKHSKRGTSELASFFLLMMIITNKQIANKLTHSVNHSLTPLSRVLSEKLTSPQLVKKWPAFYGARTFITAFTSARHLSVFRSRSIQSMPANTRREATC